MIHFCRVACCLGLAATSACQRAAPTESTTAPASTPRPVAPPACEASNALERMDARVPVPLLPMMANHQKESMRDHLLAVEEIVLAVGHDDYGAIEHAVSRMGFTPQMGRMCTHMGAGAPGFTEQAIAFHHTADSIGTAAKKRDRTGVMKALGSTLQMCTGCHQTFRQRVVDDATWTTLTSSAVPAGHHPGG